MNKEEIIKKVKKIESQANKFFGSFPEEKDYLLEKLLINISELKEELGI